MDQMTESARHDRTLRLLAGRLESIAYAAEHAGAAAPELDLSVGRAAAATRNAVRLRLITAGEADSVWRAAAERHPDARVLVRAAGPQPS